MTGAKTTPLIVTASDKSSAEHLAETGALGLTTSTWQVIALVASWMAIGLLTALALRRRGHEFGPNAALGVILGPMFVFLALDMARHRERDEPIRLSTSQEATGPPILVVAVGVVDDPRAASRAVESMGEKMGPIIAAVPVEYEVAERVHGMGEPPPASETLDQMAQAFAPASPGQMMLPGRAETSIPLAVEETGAGMVLLIGSESKSVAPTLEQILEVPVMRIAPHSSSE